jgi:hypothetical protein
MYQSHYYLEKSSNTSADNLATFGLAFVLHTIADGRARVRIEDGGAYFQIVCEPAIESSWVENTSFFVGAPFLATFVKKVGGKAIKGADVAFADLPIESTIVVDYEAEREENTQYFAWIKSLSPKERGQVMRGEMVGPRPPHPDWDIFRAINPAGLQAYNAPMAQWWKARDHFPQLLRIVLLMTSEFPNPVEQAAQAWGKLCKQEGWKADAQSTATQLLNPTQGKGATSTKGVWRAPNNVKNFWLLEWLKIVGLFQAGITRQVRNGKDRKSYVLAPRNLAWADHIAMMNGFRRAMIGSDSAVKMDILAALRYTQALLAHYETAREEDLSAQLYGQRAADLVSGLETAFYKDMGNAVVTMNVASINLPNWIKPADRTDLARMHEVLKEHVGIVRVLREDRGEQFELLVHYRNFLSGHDMKSFFAFTTAYSGFLIQQIERGEYTRPLTLTNLEILLMNSDDEKKTFQRITSTPGFRNLANAIRHSTVIPQGRKRKGTGAGPTVDVRYGLGQQLVRKAAYPTDFLAELAEFVYLYNAENAQLREKERNPFRNDVMVGDLDQITALVDDFGSKVVCNLLVAYGYARQERRVVPDELEESNEDVSFETDDGNDNEEEMDA